MSKCLVEVLVYKNNNLDSGGPLLLRGDDFEWILVGTLIGGGFDCYSPQDRSDNTSDWNKVTVHMPWIQTILDRDETTGE